MSCITASLDVTGVTRGPLRSYTVTLAQADSSDKELWELHEELLQQVRALPVWCPDTAFLVNVYPCT